MQPDVGFLADPVGAKQFAAAVVAQPEGDSIEQARQLQSRLLERATRAVRASLDESRPQMVRDICKAYLGVHKNLATYLKAALQNKEVQEWMDGKVQAFMPFTLPSFIVNIPAVWEFEFVEVTGSVNDANWCASQYRWNKFIGVRPLLPDTRFHHFRIPIIHKSNSRFRVGWENRNRLKAMLGSKYRRLVNDARGMGKGEFLEEFHKVAIPRHLQEINEIVQKSGRVLKVGYTGKQVRDITADKLLVLTGYTPEEFWREVDFLKRNNGEHVQPFKRDLFEQALAKPDVVEIIKGQKKKKAPSAVAQMNQAFKNKNKNDPHH